MAEENKELQNETLGPKAKIIKDFLDKNPSPHVNLEYWNQTRDKVITLPESALSMCINKPGTSLIRHEIPSEQVNSESLKTLFAANAHIDKAPNGDQFICWDNVAGNGHGPSGPMILEAKVQGATIEEIAGSIIMTFPKTTKYT